MAHKPIQILIKTLLISAILLSATAYIIPWGKIDAEIFWVDIYHWGGVSPSTIGESNFEIILPWTNFSNETSTINTYLYAGSSLLLYLIIPLSIASIGLGLIAYFRPKRNRKKRLFQAILTTIFTIIFSIIYILFGIIPRIEAKLSDISEAFHWTTGFYLMIAVAILYSIVFLIIHRYPQILEIQENGAIPSEKKKKS